MSAETIDPAILIPQGVIGKATNYPEFYDAVIAAINDHATLIDAGQGGGGIVYNVLDYGPVSTPAETRASILAAAAAAAAAGGGSVFWTGTLTIDRDGANSWCIDWPYSDVALVGDGFSTRLKAAAGMPNASVSLIRFNDLTRIDVQGIIFDGNWGNCVTAIEAGSHGTVLPQGTIYVGDTTNAAGSGTCVIRVANDQFQFISYTGKTATTITGCTAVTGSAGTLARHDPVVFTNSATGINHTTQADPKNHALFIRGCSNVYIARNRFVQLYGDAIWLGTPADDDLFQWTRDVRITANTVDVGARNGISFGAAVERVQIDHNIIRNVWTCGIDSEPQGFDTPNRTVHIHHNFISAWPIFPGGGQGQAMGCVAGTPQGYNQSSAGRGWRIDRNLLLGWTAINNSIDVSFTENECRTRFNTLGDTIVSAIDTGTETFTANGHGLKNGDGPIWILTSGTLPAGVTASSGNPLRSVDYWAIKVDANNFRLATTFAVAITGTTDVNVTSAGSGTITQTAPKCIAPIYIDHVSDECRVVGNYVYNNSEKSDASGEPNNGAIVVANYGSGNINLQPAGVVIENNEIHAHKGCHGVYVNAQGGFSIGDGTSVVSPLTGTATSVTNSTLFDGGSPFISTDRWAGWQLMAGSTVGLIKENTADTLTLYKPDLPLVTAIGWRDAEGDWCPAPTGTPTYVITSQVGFLRIANNRIDCRAYANTVQVPAGTPSIANPPPAATRVNLPIRG